MGLIHTHRIQLDHVYCIGMNRKLELVVGAIVSLLFMTYYWWGSLTIIGGIYIPTVVTSILLLSICFILQRFSFKRDNTLYRLFLFTLSFYLIIYMSINYFTISDQTWQEINRLSLWILASLMLHMLVLKKLSTKRILRIGLRLWVGICAITLGIKFILGDEALFLLDVIAADGRDNINVVKDISSGIDINRFVIPGLNSNTVAIQCALMLPLLMLEKKKLFQLIFGLVLIAAGFLTYSRMFFVFLFVILIMYTLIYKSIKPLVYSLILSPLVLFTNSLVYYRMLNTIDGLFGTVVLGSICLFALFGKRVVTMGNGRGLVFVGVGPLGWKRRFLYTENLIIMMVALQCIFEYIFLCILVRPGLSVRHVGSVAGSGEK